MPDQTRLLSHFASRDDNESQKSGWMQLWDTDQDDLWDRGVPSAALIDWIESHPSCLPQATHDTRLRALVPGCGKGYDVVMLALHGFDVVGLEISSKGADIARAYAEQELAEPHGYNFGSPDAVSTKDPGKVTIVAGDFFDQSWTDEKFHLIYDYTFLCALHPDMRRDWGRRMRDLADPSGVVLCLEFPLYKSPGEPGPPWPVAGVYWDLLSKGSDGKNIKGDESETAAAVSHFVRVCRFKPPRSYPKEFPSNFVHQILHSICVVLHRPTSIQKP